MSSFGFEFETIDSRKFRLDDIQPFLFVGNYILNNWGATTIQFPQYSGIANLIATLDYNSAALTWTSSYNLSTGALTITRTNPWNYENGTFRFSVYARFNV
ncbi:conserved hypothetical protein [Vibrio chagasii]|nr:conserved hypothetical protein [Vibrio chagasii]CAH7302437.1 conserved hypothetical protein [Vibrio chagasii]